MHTAPCQPIRIGPNGPATAGDRRLAFECSSQQQARRIRSSSRICGGMAMLRPRPASQLREINLQQHVASAPRAHTCRRAAAATAATIATTTATATTHRAATSTTTTTTPSGNINVYLPLVFLNTAHRTPYDECACLGKHIIGSSCSFSRISFARQPAQHAGGALGEGSRSTGAQQAG